MRVAESGLAHLSRERRQGALERARIAMQGVGELLEQVPEEVSS